MQGKRRPSRLTIRVFLRYPKWTQTFENQISFEFKTKMSNAMLLYTDDGAVQGNFYVVTVVDEHVQLDFRWVIWMQFSF